MHPPESQRHCLPRSEKWGYRSPVYWLLYPWICVISAFYHFICQLSARICCQVFACFYVH